MSFAYILLGGGALVHSNSPQEVDLVKRPFQDYKIYYYIHTHTQL